MVTEAKHEEPSHLGRWLLVGALLVIGVVVFVRELLPLSGAMVSKELRVRVFVADGDTHRPLPNVPVLVMHWVDGPPSGTDWSKTIPPVLAECYHQQFMTDDRGTVVFPWHFHAIIGTNVFGARGGFLRDTWLEIAPPGYGAVFLPLDGQSAQRRDYKNETPVVVTVFLKKPSKVPAAQEANSDTRN